MDQTKSCELCEAARFTEWYYEDDECWVAECEACCVPMIVWKTHDPTPDQETRERLHQRLLGVATSVFDYEPYIDDNMRNIPYKSVSRNQPRRWWRLLRWRNEFFTPSS